MSPGDCRFVLIDGQDAAVRRATLQQLPRMPARSECRVDVTTTRLRFEVLQGFVQKNGYMRAHAYQIPSSPSASMSDSLNPSSLIVPTKRSWFQTSRLFKLPRTATSPVIRADSRRVVGIRIRPDLSIAVN